MFADAVEKASGFTFPYVGMRRRADGGVFTLVATFVVVNTDGWIVTSAHIIEELLAARRTEAGVLPDVDRRDEAALSRITHHDEIWAVASGERPRLVGGRVSPLADVAVGRLEPFDPSWVDTLPVLRSSRSDPLRAGESVCRIGFPFHTVDAAWDEGRPGFVLAEGAFPIPRFAMDGIISRFNRRFGPKGESALFVEVSTPGLRGQSGGPLVDREGRIIGIQSQTAHLDLGFDARYVGADGATVIERQFLNVGMATHVDEVCALLDLENVEYRRA